MKLNERQSYMLAYFRNQARTSLTPMSKELGIPVSTIHENVDKMEDNGVIKRHSSILDFDDLGYTVRVIVSITAPVDSDVGEFLDDCEAVNTAWRTTSASDYVAEAVFNEMRGFDEFQREINNHDVSNVKYSIVMDDIKRERHHSYDEVMEDVRR